MALKTPKPRKVQRGISLPPDLVERIAKNAETLDMKWNDVAERALAKAFPASSDSSNPAPKSRTSALADDFTEAFTS